ncbi:MAG: transcription elongation factor Spt5, partial [Candidatus Hodarchaeota archaeon]
YWRNSRVPRVQIYALRTTIGQEKNAANLIYRKVRVRNLGVRSLIVPEALKGYLFIEANPQEIDEAITGVPHVRSKIVGRVPIEELEHLLIPKPTISGVKVGDRVEIISGPFKGSQAKISAVNMTREEVTVELLDSPVTIPVVIHADYVRTVEVSPDKDIK